MSSEKKLKLAEKVCDCVPALKIFRIDEILNENVQQKSIFILGHFEGQDGKAVMILEKTQFSQATQDGGKGLEGLLDESATVTEGMQNDIYRTFELFPRAELNGIKTTLIYPATEQHLIKYRSQDIVVINETPDDYRKITLPYIESTFSLQWVYNILEKRKEVERIVFEDPDPKIGFLLMPDMKWDLKQTSDLYMMAVPFDRTLRSLRDIRGEHAALLTNIVNKGSAAIKSQYGVGRQSLRIYLHYQPSYYHLHVHFTHIMYDAPGTGAGKAHLIDDVIDNIQLMSNFYERKTMTYMLRKNEALCKLFCDRDAQLLRHAIGDGTSSEVDSLSF